MIIYLSQQRIDEHREEKELEDIIDFCKERFKDKDQRIITEHVIGLHEKYKISIINYEELKDKICDELEKFLLTYRSCNPN
ncbi:MAG: hypothetical protein PHF86_06920 [Candidatus Nanoarchaeia archaeon]|nr:hypothetical protein [Candidatus Nanoarchaeia archaeon]